jgi:tellurite resistance protein TerA
MATVNLSKDRPVAQMRRTPELTVTVSWPAKTDYDLYALVLDRDGSVHHVAMFGAQGIPAQKSYKGVVHDGDVGRSGSSDLAEETLTIRFDDSIAAVVPVAYSAQSNGSGSFYKYQVSMTVENGYDDRIEIKAQNANRDNGIFSCVPAIIYNDPDGVRVEYLERYSKRGSENRPNVVMKVDVVMDAGPRNDYK